MNRASPRTAKSRSKEGTETQTPPTKSPWILNARQDLALFVATPLLILPLIALALTGLSAVEIAMYVGAFGAVGHHLPGMMRAYGDRPLFRRFRIRFLLAPVFLATVCLTSAFYDLNGLALLVMFWGNWHGLMQVYGFARIYDGKKGSFSPLAARLDFLMCLVWFHGGLFNSPGRMLDILQTFYKSGGPLVAPSAVHAFVTVWNVGMLTVTAAFLAHLVWRAFKGERPNLIKLPLMAISFAFWWYAMVFLNNVLLGVALFEVFHDVQYLAIVWVYNRRRVEKDPAVGSFTSFLFRRSWAMMGLYVGLVFAYGYVSLLAEIIDRETIKQSLYGVFTASALLHFYFDGFIWKVREKSTREGLGMAGGKDPGKDPGKVPLDKRRWIPPGLAHSLKWSLFVVPLVWLAWTEQQGTAEKLQQYRNLVDAVPSSDEAHTELGKLVMQANGSRREARALFEKALELNPEAGEAHVNLADIERAEGNVDKAIQHYKLAIRLKPDYAPAHVNLGLLLIAQGDLAAAVHHWEQAVAAEPNIMPAHRNLARAYQSQGRLKDAARHWRIIVKLAPQEALFRYQLGLSLQLQGETQAAEKHYRQALLQDEKLAVAHNNLGVLLRKRNQSREAIMHYREALRWNPQYAEAHCNLGYALQMEGDLLTARVHYLEALRIQPDFAPARQFLQLLQQLP